MGANMSKTAPDMPDEMPNNMPGNSAYPVVHPLLCRNCDLAGYVGGQTPPSICPECGSANIRVHADLFELTIAHIDCDAFYASIEKRDNPALADRPVIVGGGQRGVVAAACYIARQYGVRSAMPAWQALKKCPDAVVIKPRMTHYSKIGQQVRDRMLGLTPLVQPLSIDEAFLDLSGTQKLHRASPAEMLHRLQKEIKRDIGIAVSVGLACNKSLAKMASDYDKPEGFFIIGEKEAQSWLAPQDASVLFGIGKAAIARLNAAGIYTCGDLAAGDKRQLLPALGSQVERVMDLSRGIDPRPVLVEREAKTVSNETTFTMNISDRATLEAEMEALCQKLSDRLKAQGLAGRTVTLKLKLANHRLLTRSRTLPSPIDKAYMLFDTGRDLLTPEVENNRLYRLLGIGVSNFDEGDDGQLFDLPAGADDRRNRLEAAVDHLRGKLGPQSLKSGRQFARNPHNSKPDDAD